MIPFGIIVYFTIHEIKMKEPGCKTMEPGPALRTGNRQRFGQRYTDTLCLDRHEGNPLD